MQTVDRKLGSSNKVLVQSMRPLDRDQWAVGGLFSKLLGFIQYNVSVQCNQPSGEQLTLSHFILVERQIIFGISGYVKLVTLHCHAIFWEIGGLGEGCVKIMKIVSCLELMTNLFIFIHNGGIQKLLYSPHLKMVLIFFVTKVF